MRSCVLVLMQERDQTEASGQTMGRTSLSKNISRNSNGPQLDRQSRKSCLVNLGHRIRTLRQEAGISQVALARRCGVHLYSLGDIEDGVEDMALLTLYRIATGLNKTMAELLDFHE